MPLQAERVEGFLRRIDDRLASQVKRGVQNDRHPRGLAEGVDQAGNSVGSPP